MFSSNASTVSAFFLRSLRQRHVSIRIHAAFLDVTTSFLQQSIRPCEHKHSRLPTFALNSWPSFGSMGRLFFFVAVAAPSAISTSPSSSSFSRRLFLVSLLNLMRPLGPRVKPSTEVILSRYALPATSLAAFRELTSISDSSSSLITIFPVSVSVLK